MKRAAVAFFLLLGLTIETRAQNCDPILTVGIRNIAISHSKEAATASKYFNHCHKNFRDMSDSVFGSVEVEIYGSGKGGGQFSRAQRERDLTEWCQTNKETANKYKETYAETQTIYGGSVQAWSRCNDLSKRDIKFTPTITDDQKTVDITIHHTLPTKSGVSFYGVDPEGFDCNGIVATPTGSRPLTKTEATEITSEAISIKCMRHPEVRRTRGGEEYSVVPRGVISIRTAAESFQLYFVEQWTPDVPLARSLELKRSIDETNAKLEAQEKEMREIQQRLTTRIAELTTSKLSSCRIKARTFQTREDCSGPGEAESAFVPGKSECAEWSPGIVTTQFTGPPYTCLRVLICCSAK